MKRRSQTPHVDDIIARFERDLRGDAISLAAAGLKISFGMVAEVTRDFADVAIISLRTRAELECVRAAMISALAELAIPDLEPARIVDAALADTRRAIREIERARRESR